jgi:hypothetical protein
MKAEDYRKYHDLERYLLEEVQPKFERDRCLSTFDFFCIIIWKANRSKSKIANKLISMGYPDLDSTVTALVSAIVSAPTTKERLRVLIEDWKFRLPMASAMLAILYPLEFTVYDVRVCGILKDFHHAKNKANFDDMWSDYCAYLGAVRREVTHIENLRDKDRFLWGKSFALQLEKDIGNRFQSAAKKK